MTDAPPFPPDELDARLARVHRQMAARGLDALLITKPENIYYLTGLNHQGYFAYHGLIVDPDRPLTLITRAMERVTIEDQVPQVEFIGHSDSEGAASVTAEALRARGHTRSRIGIETYSQAFPPALYEGICRRLPNAGWQDATWLVDELRLVKSPREVELLRQAARVSDIMMEAAMAAAVLGNNERDVAAEVYRAMILAGGEHPGFAPFIRPTPRLNQEHTTWGDRELKADEALFLEMGASVHRYHAPLGRLVYLSEAPPASRQIREVCIDAFNEVVAALGPGRHASEVYRAWQDVVDAAGMPHYRRHHCGYLVGLAFPPSWTGGSTVVGLRHDSELILQPGMAFHILSWLMGTGRGDYFVSNTVVLGEDGAEVLTRAPAP